MDRQHHRTLVLQLVLGCQHLPAYNDHLANQKQTREFDWVAFIDDDECIVPECGNLKLFLSYQKTSAVCLNWVTFKSDGVIPRKLNPINRYFERIPLDDEMNLHVKTICQPALTRAFVNPHFAKYEKGYAVNVMGKLIDGPFTDTAIEHTCWSAERSA